MTRWPTRYSSPSPSPSESITPTGSWPRISPGRTGYSPLTIWTSVPQMVVAVIRTTASPARGRGLGTSSIRSSLTPRNTTAFIFCIVSLQTGRHWTTAEEGPFLRRRLVSPAHFDGAFVQLRDGNGGHLDFEHAVPERRDRLFGLDVL